MTATILHFPRQRPQDGRAPSQATTTEAPRPDASYGWPLPRLAAVLGWRDLGELINPTTKEGAPYRFDVAWPTQREDVERATRAERELHQGADMEAHRARALGSLPSIGAIGPDITGALNALPASVQPAITTAFASIGASLSAAIAGLGASAKGAAAIVGAPPVKSAAFAGPAHYAAGPDVSHFARIENMVTAAVARVERTARATVIPVPPPAPAPQYVFNNTIAVDGRKLGAVVTKAQMEDQRTVSSTGRFDGSSMPTPTDYAIT